MIYVPFFFCTRSPMNLFLKVKDNKYSFLSSIHFIVKWLVVFCLSFYSSSSYSLLSIVKINVHVHVAKVIDVFNDIKVQYNYQHVQEQVVKMLVNFVIRVNVVDRLVFYQQHVRKRKHDIEHHR
jgi:hypothetical protein